MRQKRIYFLRPVGQLGPVKIGCSICPESRLDVFTLWSPVPLEVAASVPGSHSDERRLHAMFDRHHVHGEWFNASKELVQLITYCELHGKLPKLPNIELVSWRRRIHKRAQTRPIKPIDKDAWAKEIRADYEAGIPSPEICDRHDIAAATMLKMVRRAGGEVRRNQSGPDDPERALRIVERYQGGETLQEIGDDLGLTRERVRQVLETMGVKRRRSPGRPRKVEA
jgi:hypothetical protein